MEGRSNRLGLDEIRNRVEGLRHEIEDLRKADLQQRLSRQSQVSWDSQKQHKQELIKLGRGMKGD